jgi:uncharacterized protein (TIGR00730 family)
MKRLCVFCGSSPGEDSAYLAGARELGQLLATTGIGVVYGGASVGLMGALADSALATGGEVIGVLPQGLWEREVGHSGLTELHIVGTMHERKALMADLADGFITLPGGIGTLEEICEILTWAQLGVHAKPCGLLDIAGYYAPLIALFDHMVAARFLKPEDRARVIVERDPARLLARFADYVAPPANKWLDRVRT